MMPAQIKLENELKEITFNDPDLPIICNYTAVAENNPLKLKENIINQVTNKVRWKETMEYALDKKIKSFRMWLRQSFIWIIQKIF